MALWLIGSLMGCVAPPPVGVTEQSRPNHYQICTAQGYKPGIGPVHITDGFIIADGNNVYVIAKFMDLVADTDYRFKFEWYRPNGDLYALKSVKQKVTSSNWFAGNFLKLDRKYQESYTPGRLSLIHI